jgi:hypothetical protein
MNSELSKVAEMARIVVLPQAKEIKYFSRRNKNSLAQRKITGQRYASQQRLDHQMSDFMGLASKLHPKTAVKSL